MQDELAVETRGLRKRYGRLTALDGLDLTVARGEVFGFLGPNGAGKSTTIRVLLGLLRPTAGSARLLGVRAGTVLSREGGRVGALVEEPAFYEYLSARRNLEVLSSLAGRVDPRRIDEVLDLVSLRERQHDPVRAFSHGMKQRLGIAQALVPRPQLLILDEPASGLDPQGLVEIRDLLLRLNQEEHMTVFLSSHLLHEIELICTDAAIVNKGKVVKRGKVTDLLAAPETAVRIVADDADRARTILESLVFVRRVEMVDGQLRATCSPEAIPDLNGALVRAGLRVSSLSRERLTLEDLYLQLMS
jgi:ABC-2 type transport system ATP-binding protein